MSEMLSNAGGRVSAMGDIVQLKVTDGACSEDDFHDLLDAVLDIFAHTEVPLKLILNAIDEEVSSEHIAALTDLLQDSTFDTKHLKGTVLILTPMQATVASILVQSLQFSRPTRVVSDEKSASEFIASI